MVGVSDLATMSCDPNSSRYGGILTELRLYLPNSKLSGFVCLPIGAIPHHWLSPRGRKVPLSSIPPITLSLTMDRISFPQSLSYLVGSRFDSAENLLDPLGSHLVVIVCPSFPGLRGVPAGDASSGSCRGGYGWFGTCHPLDPLGVMGHRVFPRTRDRSASCSPGTRGLVRLVG